MDFRRLEMVCREAYLKSFSKAADDPFLTQPTVYGHIFSLEQFLSLRPDRQGSAINESRRSILRFSKEE